VVSISVGDCDAEAPVHLQTEAGIFARPGFAQSLQPFLQEQPGAFTLSGQALELALKLPFEALHQVSPFLYLSKIPIPPSPTSSTQLILDTTSL
jgi:hypothetical protein